MRSRIDAHRGRAWLTAATAALVLATAGCTGSGDADDEASAISPQEVMATAKQHFDAAATIRFDMTTTSRPTSGSAVLAAQGTLTHQPAFQGSVTVVLFGLEAEVPVTSVDGSMHAKLPLTPSYTVIDPADYGAPDPALFADPASGFSSLLVQLENLAPGEPQRADDEVLATYTGTLTGAQVQPIIPSSSADAAYQATVGIDDQGEMATLAVTGGFFASEGPVTYHLTFDYDDNPVTITAP